MAKASQFTTTGTIDPALDMIPYMKWDGVKFVNRKVTAVNAGIQQPDYVAQSQATAARAQANEASDIADTALTTAWFGTSSGKSAAGVATAALTTAWFGTTIGHQAQAVATTALTTSWTGTSTGHEAYDVAKVALETAWTGTAAAADAIAQIGAAGSAAIAAAVALANQALVTCWAGTAANLATNAVATAALTTAWAGTALANNAYTLATYAIGLTGTASSGGGGADLDTAWAGTAAAREARAVAQTALETSWTGTGLATSAHSVASSAYAVAVSGTVGSKTVAVSSGTAILDLDGQVYQTVHITGDTAITVTNQRPITPTKVQEITAVLRSDGNAHTVICDNFTWMTDAVATIGANKEIFIGLTSFGSLVSQVYASALIEDTRFLSLDANSTTAYNMARTALNASWSGTAAGHEAYDISRTALDTAWAGTSLAAISYQTAISGTVGSVTVPVASGTAVLNMAGQSFQIVNITGDTVIDMIGELPVTPTKVQEITAILRNNATPHIVTCANFDWITSPITAINANQEIFIGFASFGSTVNQVSAAAMTDETSAAAVAHEAYDYASAAYRLASAGTVSHSTLSASAGTAVFSMSGSAYQSVVIGGATAITVTNIQAPTSTYIQAITARIHNNNSGSSFNLFWDAFGVIGAAPPALVSNNHSIFASFTSYGTAVNDVFIATATHI